MRDHSCGLDNGTFQVYVHVTEEFVWETTKVLAWQNYFEIWIKGKLVSYIVCRQQKKNYVVLCGGQNEFQIKNGPKAVIFKLLCCALKGCYFCNEAFTKTHFLGSCLQLAKTQKRKHCERVFLFRSRSFYCLRESTTGLFSTHGQH